jgi:hypothetical protein
MQMDMDKGRTNWTAEEDAVLLAHLRTNECSYRDFSGKHIFTVTQGRGGGVLYNTRSMAAASRMCDRMRVLRVIHTD